MFRRMSNLRCQHLLWQFVKVMSNKGKRGDETTDWSSFKEAGDHARTAWRGKSSLKWMRLAQQMRLCMTNVEVGCYASHIWVGVFNIRQRQRRGLEGLARHSTVMISAFDLMFCACAILLLFLHCNVNISKASTVVRLVLSLLVCLWAECPGYRSCSWVSVLVFRDFFLSESEAFVLTFRSAHALMCNGKITLARWTTQRKFYVAYTIAGREQVTWVEMNK